MELFYWFCIVCVYLDIIIRKGKNHRFQYEQPLSKNILYPSRTISRARFLGEVGNDWRFEEEQAK